MKKTILIASLLLACGLTASAQMVGATNNQQMPTPQEQSYNYRPTGSYLKFEAGIFGASIGYGYQYNPYFMFGGGVGLYGYGKEIYDIQHLIPYIEMRFSTPRYNHSLFADMKAGYDVMWEGLATTFKVGYMYKNLSFGIGAGVFPLRRYNDLYHVLMPLLMINYNLPLKNLL